MCRRVWLVALLTTALSVASMVMLVSARGWHGGAWLSAVTAAASMLVAVMTFLRRNTGDCSPIVQSDGVDSQQDS